MKRVPLLIALFLTFSFGLAYGGAVTVDHITGLWNDGTDHYATGQPIVFHIRMNNNNPANVGGFTNGFEFGGGGAVFTPIVGAWVDETSIASMFNLTHGINPFSVDGTGMDTLGFYASKMTSAGFPVGYNQIVMTITTQFAESQIGKTVCLDSAYFPPSGTWLWAPGGAPSWGGPYCYDVKKIPNLPPEITNCPTTAYTGDHCVVVSYDFNATDNESDPITWSCDLGTINPSNGMWSYTPSLADVGVAKTVTVTASDPFGHTDCSWDLNFTNVAPTCTFSSGPYQVGKGNTFTKTLTGAQNDCDPFTWELIGVTPAPVGTYDVTGNVFTFHTSDQDCPNTFDFTIRITDGNAYTDCHILVEVLCTEPFEVQIEKVEKAIQGMHHMVDVTVNKGSEILRGFDILIAYDASALNFISAVEGSIYSECGWEYFNYRYGPFGNCGNGCPSGMLRVVGIAETNNGPHHPTCFTGTIPFTLFSLDFLVTDNRTFECMYIPIRFYWMDCGDNSLAYSEIANPTPVIQGVSRFIYDYGLDPMMEISDPNTGFPTYTGVQEECFDNTPGKPLPIQFVDFINGGIDIICADSIDLRGDINLNGQANEIADAVLFSNYFVYGLGVFTVNVAGQIAASDVNADGLTLSVADLVYQIRVILGDALPYSKLSTVAANYTVDGGVVSVDQPMGAAFIVAAGNVTPTLLADNMDLLYNYDGSNTRILVSSMEMGQTFNGQFISVNGNVLSVELATYEGARVVANEIPSEYALAQNYPNPFNPVTTIGFSLKQASDYTLTIYNVTGQKVAEFAGHANAGNQTVTWNAENQASGIYFYKLSTNNFTDTKKMVLLK